MFNSILENTILLFVAVDPIALVPIFASLTRGLPKETIRKIYTQASIISFVVISLFWLFGSAILEIMGISMSSFKIIGGLFLIAIAFQMVFEQRNDRKQNTAETALEDDSIQSVAIFPLSIPLIAGPGALTAALLMAEDRIAEPLPLLINYSPIVIVVLFAFIAMWLSSQLSRKLGPTIITVIEKIFGILLGALAIEFVVAGINESFNLL
jgi:multiple antibiotic resistance protein